MKKLLLALAVLAVVSGTLFAFDPMSYPPPVKGGNLLVDLGIGVGLGYKTYGNVSIPALSADVEYALPVNVPISVGGAFGIVQYKRNFGYVGSDVTETWTYTIFGAKGNWHWGFDVPWLDFYSGLFLGYRYFSWDFEGYSGSYPEPDYNGFVPGGQIGAHFYFTKNIGAVIEFGMPFSKIGLALKF